jgi:hypothetical protein
MLYIVQIVVSGVAEIPKLFSDEIRAQVAFVEYTKEFWAQSYPLYCERNAVSKDSFSSAKAFLTSFDLADRNRINYWIVRPEDTGLGTLGHAASGMDSSAEQREHIQRLTREAKQTTLVVKEELTLLLDKLAALTDNVTCLDSLLTDENNSEAPEDDSEVTFAIIPSEELEEIDEQYTTPEWKFYVSSVRNLCGGSWSEFPLFTRHDWRQDVYGNYTSLEYWEWVAIKIDTCTKMAKKAGYSVIAESDQAGQYRFISADGFESELSWSSQEEAWCHAAFHSEG